MDLTRYKKKWFTSDLHFSHKNIMKFCPKTRPYRDTREMNEHLIEVWNANVGFEDLVFITGDVSFGTEEETVKILHRLNGTKVLVIGNHDHRNMRNSAFRDCFILCKDYLTILLDDIKVVMFHYPILEWDQMHRGSFHLFGHVHGNKVGNKGRSMDIGWDAHGKLLSWDEIKASLIKKPIEEHHGD